MASKVVLVVLAVVATASARVVPSTSSPDGQPEDIGSPLMVAQCRAQCLQRFTAAAQSERPERPAQCLQSPDCYMCWENCQLLQSNYPVWGAMCSEKTLCFPGCQQACAFHRRARPHRQQQAVVLTGGLAAVRVAAGRASWPAARAAADGPAPRHLVYVLMRRTTQPAWTQIAQTVDLSARLPEDLAVDRHSLRVLAVGPDGLHTIYSPEAAAAASSPASSTHTSTAAPSTAAPTASSASSSSVEGGAQRRINTAIRPAAPAARPHAPAPLPPQPKEQGWQLREDSLIHQKVLVIAELSWAQRGPAGGVYLVTWEVDGGGLKGNLFTDSTHVTLSLWPDTVYHVQVELVSDSRPGPAQSASLVVDTRHAVPSTLGSRGPTASSRIPLSIAPAAAAASSSSSSSSSSLAPPSPHSPPAKPHSGDDVALRRGPFLMLASVPSKRHLAEKQLGEARHAALRPVGGASLLAVAAAVMLVSLAGGAVLVWRCRGAFFRRGAGVVGDSSPFIGALAVEEGDLPPSATKKAGALSAFAAFTVPPPPPVEAPAPVVTLVCEDASRSGDSCHCCPRTASTETRAEPSPSWRHVNMASAWSLSPSSPSPAPCPPSPSPSPSPSSVARV